ncbi:MAG: UvrD/REP helicase [Ignavibacteria bacterium]|nr:UvrD/REP helicase [Ignavibacteria bacterium]
MTLKLIPEKDAKQQSKILDGLNKEQSEAVTTIDGPLLVIAGAGSGKTRVLTHRIAYLLEQGIPPYSILALTFTNKAAEEMKARIAKLVGSESAGQIWAGTFHSVFARILRREAEKINYTQSFSIYDTDDSTSAIRQVMNATGIDQKQFSPQSMRSRISFAKNQMISWQEYSNSASSLLEKQTAIVYDGYEARLGASNAMDFDDILTNFIRMLQSSSETLLYYQKRFQYILVDEYQDTNRAQYIACKLLAGGHKNICVVGDDAQSIYRWRGADIRNILDFQKDYPDAVTVRLEQNYRSTGTILAAADSIIKRNRKQIPKKLWTANPEGELVELQSCINEYNEADLIANKVKELSKKEYTLGDFAVLYRTNAQSLPLENSLRQLNFPYVVVGGMSFYKRKEIKDTLSYLRLLVNPSDSEALLRCVNEPPRGIGATSLKYLVHFAELKKISLIEAFRNASEVSELQPRAVTAASKFFGFIKSHIDKKENTPPAALAIGLIEECGMLEMYKEINTEESLDRWNNIQQLLSDISSFFRTNKENTLEDYIERISLIADVDEKEFSTEKVSLLTLHAAKGLEFPIVFIAGLEQGLFPLVKADQHPDELEEERRLFYVGITRAQERVFLSYAEKRMRFGEQSYQSPSQFLEEINRTLIKDSDFLVKSRDVQSVKPAMPAVNYNYKREKPARKPVIETKIIFPFHPGDKVTHAKFGDGKLLALSGEGDNTQALVNFTSVGRKNLLLKFAKLEKI